ncbi:hypothetical protein SOCE26_058360 [Sorangium cellulosum]|uniref:DUF2169 domain-containing protein n=1 Tax=Sorangium cellulosum TaxID=56 RepID=A0A2L0EYJ9_SORCE|nr:DUF2169 domain-containing protein [Sorangium cellulosum]AUX44372.1 hypothetical protein SOCE26_058360 [Sorangium cellulosum]
MRVVKPLKVPVLTRVVETARRLRFHVGAMVAFPLDAPRALLDEMTFWQAATAALGGLPLDDGIAKARGELLVAGRCHAPEGRRVAASFVRARLGSIDKRLAVLGDRHWTGHGFTEPEPFSEMPIDWAHALGGPKDAANPYGKGIEEVERGGQRLRPLPNVEHYGALIRSPSDRPGPASFLPMDVTFAQRRARAGTYGADYAEKWAPGLPPDVDPSFFNVAPSDQWSAEPFRGDEVFLVENMHPARPRIEGALPGLCARVFVTRRDAGGEVFLELPVRCDTVWLFPSDNLGAVIFHGAVPVAEDDAAEIVDLVVACEEIGHPRPIEHYRAALARRLDKDRGAIAGLSDSDLMPPRESGVAANIAGFDMMQWMRSENLAARNQRRGAERVRERRRQELLADGMDPARYGLDAPLPDEEAPPPVDDLDALVVYLDAASRKLEEEEARAARVKEEAEARSKERAAAMGISEAELRRGESEEAHGGPPAFSARAQLAQYAELAEAGRRGGVPNVELEAMLADPAFHERLFRLERAARDGYRGAAHLLPAAQPMTAEAAQMARVVVEAAREAGEPLDERDLTGADFRGLDLRGVSLQRVFLEGADLRGCDLSGAALDGAVLAKADLTGANLTGARLRGANLGKANLAGAVLEGADLTEAILTDAKLAGARLARARLERADVMQVAWDGVDLSGAELVACTFLQTSFAGAKLAGANLERATLIECALDGADLSGARLHKATLMSCTGARARFAGARFSEGVAVHKSGLPEADFRDAVLEKTCFRTTDLRGARFDRAQMTMADLSEADATGAIFDQAVLKSALLIRTNLDGASLRGCNLTEAILSKSRVAGADFTGAQLCRADFSRARGDDRTTFAEAAVDFTRFDRHGAQAAGGAT